MCGFNFTISGNALTVNTKSKFFEAASGQYFVNMYLIFNNVAKLQEVKDSNELMRVHRDLLRYSATSANHHGVSIATGSVPQNSEFLKTFNYTLDPTWKKSDITIMTLMWKYDGSDYTFVNGSRSAMDPTAVQDIAEDNNAIQIFPTATSDKVFVKMDGSISSNEINIKVFDISGKLISDNQYGSDAVNGLTELSKANNFGDQAGFYLVSVHAGEVRKTVRVIIN